MPDFSERSQTPEIMDDLNCSGEVVNQTLRELEFINKWLGGNQVTMRGVRQLLRVNRSAQRFTITDLGCGGGDMLALLRRMLDGSGRQVRFIGIDANPNIIAFARANTRNFPEIGYEVKDVFSHNFKNIKSDIVVATLFLHHFTNEQLIEFFSDLKKQVRVGIVINDLHRHWLAYYSIRLLTTLFSKSSMVKYDAPLSVLRSFRKDDWMYILKSAGISRFSLRWRWAFRWQLVIRLDGEGLF